MCIGIGAFIKNRLAKIAVIDIFEVSDAMNASWWTRMRITNGEFTEQRMINTERN